MLVANIHKQIKGPYPFASLGQLHLHENGIVIVKLLKPHEGRFMARPLPGVPAELQEYIEGDLIWESPEGVRRFMGRIDSTDNENGVTYWGHIEMTKGAMVALRNKEAVVLAVEE
jgi:hypothetical protein